MMLHLYDVGNHEVDVLIVQWWAEMQQSGDLNRMFGKPPSLGKLFDGLKPPTVSVFAVDEKGIWFMAWFEPVLSGALFSVWISERKRHGKSALQAFRQAAELGLKEYSQLIGITKQEPLLDEHRRLGYRILTELPGFFGGETAWIMVLDKEGLEQHGNTSPL